MITDAKRNIAVIFGGPGPEHDVSVISAHQTMDAVDRRKNIVVPVYLDFENRFLTGPQLRDITKFKPVPEGVKQADFTWGDIGPVMRVKGQADVPIHCVLPVMHGSFGEDGHIQAYFEFLGFPITGFNAAHSAIAMNKHTCKTVIKANNVPVVPDVTVTKHDLSAGLDFAAHVETSFNLPAIVKPVSLGSSIGVGLAKNPDELRHLVHMVLRQDHTALIEPQVQNLVEYNVAVAQLDGKICLSAIEQPKTGDDLLDFKEKYLSSNGGVKGRFLPSEGMLSLTRDINPELDDHIKTQIYTFAIAVFRALGARGAPRIDFMCDSQTKQIWFNEINPIPGSYGFFLWEAARENHLLFSQLINHLIDEAVSDTLKKFDDPVPQGAQLLPRG